MIFLRIMKQKNKTLVFQYLKILFFFIGFIIIMVFKRQFFPSQIIFYEGLMSSFFYFMLIFLIKYLDLDKSIILFLICFLFWSLIPTIVERSVSVTILGKLDTANYKSYNELSKDFSKVYLEDNDAIGKRLFEQIRNGNVIKKNNKYILSGKGLSTKKSFFFITKIFNINNSLLEKR